MSIFILKLIDPVINTISHEKARTTMVLIAVATLESMFLIPHFAKIAVKPAKTAEPNANAIHITKPLFSYCPSAFFAVLLLYTVFYRLPRSIYSVIYALILRNCSLVTGFCDSKSISFSRYPCLFTICLLSGNCSSKTRDICPTR